MSGGQVENISLPFVAYKDKRGLHISTGDLDPHRIMTRKSVFAEKPSSIYLSRDTSYALTTSQGAHIAQASCVAEEKYPTVLILPDQVKEATAGAHNWRRQIYNIIDPTVKSCHLVVGETFNPPGNWSSWPPHRHDHDNPPIESDLEEVYYFKVNPPGGFGIQRAYNDDRSLDETYVLQDGDLVALPEGYHPVVAAPGYELYYLWVLAGKKRVLQPRTQATHAWVGHTEAIIKDILR